MKSEFHEETRRSGSSGLILGVGVILLGLVLMMDQIPGIRETGIPGLLKHLWPLILVAMGVSRLKDPGRPGRGRGLIIAGVILLAMTLGHGHLEALAWPGILLGAGIVIVLHALRKQRGLPPGSVASEDLLRASAVLSAIKRSYRSQAFQGGELTALFGGLDLDLRQATMAGDSVSVDLFLLFGGAEIRVPEHWDVILNATAIAGGMNDKNPPGPTASDVRPRLVLTGLILFGGIEIKR